MGSLKTRLIKAAAVPVAAAMMWSVSVSDAGANAQYVVKPGDNLWTIACKHQTTVDTIINVNGLSSSLIFPGQRLSLSTQKPASAPASPPAGTVSNSRYTVQKGDSLWTIGMRHGVSVDALKSANGLTGDALSVGQTLILPGARPAAAAPAVSRSGDRGQAIVDYARTHLGTPYRWAGASPGGFDCSGFAYHVYSHFGITIPRTSFDQFSAGTAVGKGELRPGDLVFFNTYASGASHTGIYSGNNQFIHSSSARGGCGVIYSSLGDSYYSARYVGARRVLP